MTLTDFERELCALVARAQDARLDPGEIADALQAELDEVEVVAGPAVKSARLPVDG